MWSMKHTFHFTDLYRQISNHPHYYNKLLKNATWKEVAEALKKILGLQSFLRRKKLRKKVNKFLLVFFCPEPGNPAILKFILSFSRLHKCRNVLSFCV